MELIIKHSDLITIIIQAFLITATGFLFVFCCDEVIDGINEKLKMFFIRRIYMRRKKKYYQKIQKRIGGSKHMREYTCPNCGYSAWALDHLLTVNCKCGTVVETKPVPVNEDEKSFVCDERKFKRMA